MKIHMLLLVVAICGRIATSLAFEIPASLRSQVLASLEQTGSTDVPSNVPLDQSVDNSIDPDLYIIGAGDIFTISMVELPSVNYTAQVNARGDMIVRGLGIIHVGNSTLSQARTIIADKIAQITRTKHTVYVSLSQTKTARISVTGNVKKPGTYQLSGATRLGDALSRANNGELPDIAENDYRQIKRLNADSISNIDMYPYFLKGDISANPYIYPGDRLVVGPSLSRAYLFGKGIPDRFTTYVLKPNETLQEMIELFEPFDESIDTSYVTLQSGSNTSERTIRNIKQTEYSAVVLSDQDIVSFPAKNNYPTLKKITIAGEVRRPGTYAVPEGKMTADEIFELAGGTNAAADQHRSVIIRSQDQEGPAGLSRGIMANAQFQTMSARPELTAAISKAIVLNDFAVLDLSEISGSIEVRNGDRVVVPQRETMVYISGNVKSPGAYPYVSTQNLRSYIKRAGGFTRSAYRGNMMIMRRWGDYVQLVTTDTPEAGDIIVVPDTQESKFLRFMIVPITQTFASTLTVILAIITLVRQ